ncbi:E3 SUMO-protein ligase ZBED1-like [Maniola jurtina]|uniref:E3 SUMO-protein ligase ZBED1-like n=1 Tax=Maniola jurtina TaxID=191418 RepID=UPI001E68EB14|nr:E3 SUMO-protein ligase ZBED1-like [Maniola jurtina]
MSASVWQYFEKVRGETVAKCKLCQKDYSYRSSITNLKKHLSYKHPIAYENCLNSQRTLRKSVKLEHENQLVSVIDLEDEGSSTVYQLDIVPSDIQIVSPCKLQQPKQKSTNVPVQRKVDKKRKKLIDKKLLQMIIQDYQPFSVVEDEGFKGFVEALNPSYELPDRKLISGTLIPQQYLECKSQVIELVHKAEKVCLTTECWTSSSKDAYLAVTAHFLVNYELVTVLLHCEHFSGCQTAEASALASVLSSIASEWNISDKITLVVSDNAPNMISAVQQNGWPLFNCFLHKLNLVIKKALQKINVILEKLKKIVAHFKKNYLATEALERYQIDFENRSEALRLIQSVPTRWNSVYYMLERFLKLQVALPVVMPALKAGLPLITVEMWEVIRQVCIILKPFEEIAQIMSGNQYLPASLAIVIVDGLKNVISIMKTKSILGVAEEFLKELDEGMNTYFPENEIEDNMLLGICTFLDPRFKSHAFVEDKDLEMDAGEEMCQRTMRAYLIKERVLELLKTKLREKRGTSEDDYDPLSHTSRPTSSSVEDIENISIWGKINKSIAASVTPLVDDFNTTARKELDMFLKEEVAQRDSCPLEWWKSHACIYPNLAEIFSDHGHLVVTSVECERAFSKAGSLVTEKRALLSRKRATELLFIKSNEAYCE